MSRPTSALSAMVFCSAALLVGAPVARGATFGTVVPVRGHVSDIAVDESRNLLYAANFTGSRIEVLPLSGRTLDTPILLSSAQPSSIAVSPDGHFLVAGHYGSGTPPASGLTVVDLTTRLTRSIGLGTEQVLATEFGNGSQALLVTTSGVSRLDPATGVITRLSLTDFTSKALAVPWATQPAAIISATSSVSGDRNAIYVMVDNGTEASLLSYDVRTGAAVLAIGATGIATVPRALSVDRTGRKILLGSALLQASPTEYTGLAQFPTPIAVLSQGGHAFDWEQHLIYAQVSPLALATAGSSGKFPLLQIFDDDNLTVKESLQLSENLAGKALIHGGQMYAISDSGLYVLPIRSLSQEHRIAAVQEDLLFQSNGCSQGLLTQFLDVVDPGGNATEFTVQSATPGVTFSARSGVTPARIRITVDPVAFLSQQGTTAVQVTVSSASSVNPETSVRLLINTKNPDQQGTITNIPGTLVDILSDPLRGRFYAIRQDRNEVLVFDAGTMKQVGTLRTGNTPLQMAIYQSELLVTNDNSQVISAFSLDRLEATEPITLPPGLYARSIAVGHEKILVTTRSAIGSPKLLIVNMAGRIATALPDIVYKNQIEPHAVLSASPSGESIFMAMPSGTVALFDTASGTFIASRKDASSLSGAYVALSDELFLAGNTLFGPSLVPKGQVSLLGGVSSGVALFDGKGLLSSAPSGATNGVLQRFTLESFESVSPARLVEAPVLTLPSRPAPIDHVGQTILPFSRTLAVLPGSSRFLQLSTSGWTVLPAAFDAPSAPPVLRAVTNAADNGKGIAPGGLVTLWGENLSDRAVSATSLPLSSGLNDVCVYSNSVPVPLQFVSPNQINAQLPYGAPGTADLTVVNSRGQSVPLRVTVQESAPAVFRLADGAPLVVRADNGRVISESNPIHLDGRIIVYLTGLGAVSPFTEAGAAPPPGTLVTTSVVPKVYIGPVQLFTLWSGLAPGFAGVNQINAQVPFKSVSTGSKVQFTILQGNVQTVMYLPVR